MIIATGAASATTATEAAYYAYNARHFDDRYGLRTCSRKKRAVSTREETIARIGAGEAEAERERLGRVE